MAGLAAITNPLVSSAATQSSSPGKPLLKKGLGIGMIREDLTLADKFKLVKDLGFDGVEMNSPTGLVTSEVVSAAQKAGIELPSVVNKDHWGKPLTDPDPDVRNQCIE